MKYSKPLIHTFSATPVHAFCTGGTRGELVVFVWSTLVCVPLVCELDVCVPLLTCADDAAVEAGAAGRACWAGAMRTGPGGGPAGRASSATSSSSSWIVRKHWKGPNSSLKYTYREGNKEQV
jgi:hypothetical protein